MAVFRVTGENAAKEQCSNLVVAKTEKEALRLFLEIWKEKYLFNIQIEEI